MKDNEKICPICEGFGMVKIKNPIPCPCPTTFCYKCENREGFIIKPFEECIECYGSGTFL